jgi:hypothetical protein
MPAIHRTQLLMEAEEFRRLRLEARKRKKSVAELIRAAVRQVYFSLETPSDKEEAIERLLKLRQEDLDFSNWQRVKLEFTSQRNELP